MFANLNPVELQNLRTKVRSSIAKLMRNGDWNTLSDLYGIQDDVVDAIWNS